MIMVRYFAYGSNMLTERLRARVPSCQPLGIAVLPRRRLRFWKRSQDESGKCDIAPGDSSDKVFGVLYTLDAREIEELDRAEGAGHGYKRISVEVESDGKSYTCETYLATCTYIDKTLEPYDWYLDLVLAGARQHNLPSEYIRRIEATKAKPDSEPARKERLKALELLKKHGKEHFDCEGGAPR